MIVGRPDYYTRFPASNSIHRTEIVEDQESLSRLENTFWKLQSIPQFSDEGGQLFDQENILKSFGIRRNSEEYWENNIIKENDREQTLEPTTTGPTVNLIEVRDNYPRNPKATFSLSVDTQGSSGTTSLLPIDNHCLTPDVTAANTPVMRTNEGHNKNLQMSTMNNRTNLTISNSSIQRSRDLRPMDEVWFLTPVFAKYFPDTDEADLQYLIRKRDFNLTSALKNPDKKYFEWQTAFKFHLQVFQPGYSSQERQLFDSDEVLETPRNKVLTKRRPALCPRTDIYPLNKGITLKSGSNYSDGMSEQLVQYPNRVHLVNKFLEENEPPEEPRKDQVLADMMAQHEMYKLLNVSPSILNAKFFKPLPDVSTSAAPLIHIRRPGGNI